jgi:HK97 family phage portal protein
VWPFRSKPDIEIKAATLAEPDAELYETFTGLAPGSVGVTGSAALHVPAVSAAVRTIAEAAASLDIVVERKEGNKWTADEDHPAAKLLHRDGSVNDWTSSFEFVRDLVAQALTNDAGGLAWVGRGDGKPVEIVHYRTSTITVEYPDDTQEPKYRRGGNLIAPGDIIHLRGAFNKCPLTLASEAIGAAKTMEKYAANLFNKGAKPSGVIEIPGNVGEPVITRLKAAWRKTHAGPANSGDTAVLFAGAKFSQMQLTSVDAQFLEMRKFQIEEVARAFRVPLGLLYEMTRQTWSNMESATREFLIFSLEGWLRALEACLSRALIDKDDRGTIRIRLDRDDLTRADLQVRATAINSLRASEVLSADEARDWLDLGPRADGKGNTYDNPNITISPAKPPAKAA